MQHPQPRPEVWPVIHVSTPSLALENAAIALQHGCAGIFLIHHEGLDDQLAPIGHEVKRRYPSLKIGINYLSRSAEDALKQSLANGFDATWSDAPGVRSDGVTGEARAIGSTLLNHPEHLFFGSVAFKHQPVDPTPSMAALAAGRLGMIPTTSGVRTGSAPAIEKMRDMRAAIGNSPLALASGVTPDNCRELGAFLTHILVASGISRSWHEFDPALLRSLMLNLS